MNARLGIYLKILSALCATLMLACVKGLQGAIPTGEVIFFRSFIAMFPLLIWLKIQGNVLASIKTKNIFGHLIRGFSGTGGMYFNYLALVSISLADATALSYAAPLFTVIMAALLLKERVRFSRWLGVIVGFSGILFMLSASLTASGSLFAGGHLQWLSASRSPCLPLFAPPPPTFRSVFSTALKNLAPSSFTSR